MELATESNDATENVEAATKADIAAEAKRTSQGPNVELPKSEPKTEKSKQDTTADGKAEPKVEAKPEQVLESLKQDDKKPDPGHSVDKGLQKFQMQMADVKEQLEASRQERSEIKDLLAKIAANKEPTRKEQSVLENLSDDDFADGKTVKQGLKEVVAHLDGQIKELKDAQKQATQEIKESSKPQPRELSETEVQQGVSNMFPDLAKQSGDYIPWIVQQASPVMEQFKADHPKASKEWLRHEATRILGDQANILRSAIAKQSNGTHSEPSTTKSQSKPTGSTKVVNDSASPVTAVETEGRVMDSMDAAEEKWLNAPS